MGPGETSHAYALALALSKKGANIYFCVRKKENMFFVKNKSSFKVFLTPNPISLKKIIEKEEPHVLLFFNSKTWGRRKLFSEKPLFKKPPLVFCVDSNWLFNERKYPIFKYIKWADNYLITFPEEIFQAGLKKNKGDFIVSPEILEKIVPIGFVPSYAKPSKKIIKKIRSEYSIGSQDKLIFAYMSGFGAGYRFWAFENLIRATKRLIKKNYKIKVLFIKPDNGYSEKIPTYDWLIIKENLSAEMFFLSLASSDLVFQHQGLATLAQSISAKVPVIANVSSVGQHIPRLHFYELNPFKKLGLCKLFSKSTQNKKISDTIESLLFDFKERKKIIDKQKLYYEKGEENFLKLMMKLTKNL